MKFNYDNLLTFENWCENLPDVGRAKDVGALGVVKLIFGGCTDEGGYIKKKILISGKQKRD